VQTLLMEVGTPPTDTAMRVNTQLLHHCNNTVSIL
jgi:hypothetical protein